MRDDRTTWTGFGRGDVGKIPRGPQDARQCSIVAPSSCCPTQPLAARSFAPLPADKSIRERRADTAGPTRMCPKTPRRPRPAPRRSASPSTRSGSASSPTARTRSVSSAGRRQRGGPCLAEVSTLPHTVVLHCPLFSDRVEDAHRGCYMAVMSARQAAVRS